MARLDDLRNLRSDLLERMAACKSDQNYGTLGRLLVDVVKQIDELDPAASADKPRTGLSEFEEKLRERESGAKTSRRAKSS